MDEEEIKIKMDDEVDSSLASEGTDLFVDLWEAQTCLWDPVVVSKLVFQNDIVLS